MAAAPIWELEEDGILDDLFEEFDGDDGGVGPEGEDAPPELAMAAAAQPQNFEEFDGDDDGVGPEGEDAPPALAIAAHAQDQTFEEFLEELYGPDPEMAEAEIVIAAQEEDEAGEGVDGDMPDLAVLLGHQGTGEEAPGEDLHMEAMGELLGHQYVKEPLGHQYQVDGGDDNPEHSLLGHDDSEQKLADEPLSGCPHYIDGLQGLKDLQDNPSTHTSIDHYEIRSYQFADVHSMLVIVLYMRDVMSKLLVGNFSPLAQAGQLSQCLHELGRHVDSVLKSPDVKPENVLPLGDYIALLSSNSSKQPPDFRKHILAIAASISSFISTVLPDPGMKRDTPLPAHSVDQAAYRSRIKALSAALSDIKGVKVQYPDDIDASYSKLSSHPESPLALRVPSPESRNEPHYPAFQFAEEDQVDNSLSSHATTEEYFEDYSVEEDDPAYSSDVDCTQHQEHELYLVDEPFKIRDLTDLQHMKKEPQPYYGCFHYILRSYTFKDVHEIEEMIKELSSQHKWKSVGNLELLEPVSNLRFLLRNIRTEFELISRQMQNHELTELNQLMTRLDTQARLLRPRSLRFLVHQLSTAMQAFLAAFTYNNNSHASASTHPNPSRGVVIHEGDIGRLLQWVFLCVDSIEDARIRYPTDPEPAVSPVHSPDHP